MCMSMTVVAHNLAGTSFMSACKRATKNCVLSGQTTLSILLRTPLLIGTTDYSKPAPGNDCSGSLEYSLFLPGMFFLTF